jgi:hypothetical protein
MTAINFEKLRIYAIECRIQQPQPEKFNFTGLSVEVVEPPLHGSFNLVYVLKFSDDVKWVARFPIQGTRVKEADIDKMNTEYSNLKYIRKMYPIPVPEVYSWDTTCEKVGAPLALMSSMDGQSVRNRWLEKEWITEDKKLQILGNLAHIMAKLQEPKFEKIGTLRFSDEETISHIGPDYQVLEDEERCYEEGIVNVDFSGPWNSLDE